MPNYHMFRLEPDGSLRLLTQLDQPVAGTTNDAAVQKFLSDKKPTQGGRLVAIDTAGIAQYDVTPKEGWDVAKVGA